MEILNRQYTRPNTFSAISQKTANHDLEDNRVELLSQSSIKELLLSYMQIVTRLSGQASMKKITILEQQGKKNLKIGSLVLDGNAQG